MIASINGKVLHKEGDSAVIALGGAGLQVFAPAPLLDRLSVNDQVFLHTYLVVRQDALTLYGFATLEEKALFVVLLGVSGIGPRLALSVLSTLNPDAIRRAVYHEQADVFSRVPGVGKKTAQKMMLHLQDKIGEVDGLGAVAALTDVDTEVLEALVSLGYSVVEAQAALQSVRRDAPEEVEARLRLALQYFA